MLIFSPVPYLFHVLLQIPLNINHQKFNNFLLCVVKNFNMIKCISCSFDLYFLFIFFLFHFSFHRFDLDSAWSFFASAKSISPFPILSQRLRALSNLLKFSSAVRPVYFYTKLLGLTLLSFCLIQLFLQAFDVQVY